MPVKSIQTLKEFQAVINSGKPVVIDLWATGCGPCRAIRPMFDQLSDASENIMVGFYEIDIAFQEEIAQELGIKSVPTFMVFKDGNKILDRIGAYPEALNDLVSRARDLL